MVVVVVSEKDTGPQPFSDAWATGERDSASLREVKSFEVESGDRAAAGSVRRGGGKNSLAGQKNGRDGARVVVRKSRPTRSAKDGVEKGKERPCASTGSRLTHPTPLTSSIHWPSPKSSVYTSLHAK